MTTDHRGAGHEGEDRDLNSHVEDARNIDDNESTNSSETMLDFGGSEVDGNLSASCPLAQQVGRLEHTHQGKK